MSSLKLRFVAIICWKVFLDTAQIDSLKPNILIILADDVGTGDIPLYWNSGLVEMPNVQRLADMGVTFRDAHSTPLCAPSRYMLLSGNYPHRGRVPGSSWILGKENNQFWMNQQSIAETLARDGYHTAMYGKWHLGVKIPLTPNGTMNTRKLLTHEGHDWSLPVIDGPQDIGFASSRITSGGIQAPPYSFFRDGFLESKISKVRTWKTGNYSMPLGTSFVQKPGEGDPDWDSTAYNMIVVQEAASFVDTHMASDRKTDPWFLYASLGAVHGPHSPPDKYLDGTPIAETYKSKHMDMLLEMDKAVGSLVTMVEERGLANDTMIIFLSDNGGLNGISGSTEQGHNSHGPLRGAKGDIYEGGHRVPLIFRYDGHFPVNESRSHMVGLNDIYRTLCNMVGIKVPKTSAQDSKGFLDYIFSDEKVKFLRKELFTWAILRKSVSESIRNRNMKLILHRYSNGTKPSVELYNLTNDLSEEKNIIDKSPNELVKIMRRRLSREGPCPADRRTRFKLLTGPEKGQWKTCNFFKSDPTRCHNGIYTDGEKKCSSICGKHTKFCYRYYTVVP